MKKLSMISLALVLAMHGAASATPVEEKNVLSGKTKLDPTKGYIFISGQSRQNGIFLRVPDYQTKAEYEADRQKAFAKAVKRYEGEMRSWKAMLPDGMSPNDPKAPERPEEPRLETISPGPIELRDMESFGPQFVYAKGAQISYMNEVKPGTYVWYGPMYYLPGAAATGPCYCMGTVRFEVKPGMITNLGTSLANAPQWEEDLDVARSKMRQLNEQRKAAGKEPLKTASSGPVDYSIPASLGNWQSVQAELHASPKMNNYFGGTVSRVAPIPGVLAYHRDIIVDVRTGQEIESPTLVTRAKIKK